jgi:hypothetical protein
MFGIEKSKKTSDGAPVTPGVEPGFGTGLLTQLSADPTERSLDAHTEIIDEERMLDDIAAVFADVDIEITPSGAEVNGTCALLAESDDANGDRSVTVVVAGRRVGHLPPELSGMYAPKLAALAAGGHAVTGDVRIWATEKPGGMYARTSVSIPAAAAL